MMAHLSCYEHRPQAPGPRRQRASLPPHRRDAVPRQAPGEPRGGARDAGSRRTKTTEKFYARLKATKAIELFTTAVFGERDAMIEQLKLGRKKKS